MSALLPDSIRVIERGWLSSNNIVLFDGDEAALIDSGYCSKAAQTVALVRETLAGRRLSRLLNTHSHSDHIGGNAAVRRAFGCDILIPEGMVAAVSAWDEAALLLTVAEQQAERFEFAGQFAAGESVIMGEGAWRVVAAPGHDMDAVMFHDADRRILVSGDALWRDGFGILFADVLGLGDGLGQARETLEHIGRLSVDVVIPGHGEPFADVEEALGRAFGRLAAFEADGGRIARNAIRACFTFSLLDARTVALDDLAEHLDRVPLYHQANRRFLGLSPDALAQWLVADLVRAGVAQRDGRNLIAV